MSFEMQGMKFTGCARLDMDKLVQLDYAGRVNWLKHRFELVFLTPFMRCRDVEPGWWQLVIGNRSTRAGIGFLGGC